MFNFLFRKNYVKSLSKTKSMFSVAYEKASKLVEKMQKDIDNKVAQAAELTSQAASIRATQNEAKTFMSNLEKFLK